MKRVPPELDSLMWTLAEQGNDRAMDEFGERHPELRSELLHRISMVKGLRGEKKRTADPPKAIPRFVPRETQSGSPMVVVGGLVLCAVAALAYLTTVLLSPVQPTRRVEHPKEGLPKIVVPAPSLNQPVVIKGETKPPAPPVEEPSTEPALVKGSLKIDNARLLDVIQLISGTCKIRIDPAPGMPNPEVMVNYSDKNAMEMLADLGAQYGFTPLNQHDGSILVVPARDPNAPLTYQGDSNSDKRPKIGG